MAITKKLALWVFNALQHNYTHKELAYNHILVFLQNQSQSYNFAIRTKVYTSSETGQPSLLLNLYGSISLGDSIQAPVEIWIPYNYPSGYSTSRSNSYNSTGYANGQSDPLFDVNGSIPIIYVIADHSKNYYLHAGNYVDTSGRFYNPYLSSWYQESSLRPSVPNTPISAKYDLLQLINVVAESLRAEPPIYSIYEASPPQALSSQASRSQQSSGYQSGPSLPPQIPINQIQNQHTKFQSPLEQQNTSSSQQFTSSVQQLTDSYTGDSNTSGHTAPPPNEPPLPPKPPKLPKTSEETHSPSPSIGFRRTSGTTEAPQLPPFGIHVEQQTTDSSYSPSGPPQTSQNPVHNEPPNIQSVRNVPFVPQFTGSNSVSFAQQTDSNGPPPLPQKPYRPFAESRVEQNTTLSEYRNVTTVLRDASPRYNSATPVYDSTNPVYNPVPERYRSPPSLPSEQNYQHNYQTVDIRSPSESPRFTPKPAYVSQVREQPSYSPSPQTSQNQMQVSPNSETQYAPVVPSTAASVPVQHVPSVDLLSGGTDGPSTNSTSNAERRQVLEQLAAKFNSFLNDAYNDNIDNSLPKVRETHQKVEALYSQLCHIYQQAVENSRSLDGHIAYLTQQVNAINVLNQDLVKLDEINSESLDNVTTAPGTKMPLDNLIIPDSPLVRQLYETVSEIKAVRDTINLVGGSFHSEKELINDARMDLCVKTVRNLGRELFWLELTKQEIAHNIMGLSSNSYDM